MRARMALAASGLPVRVREIILRDKPGEMLAASPKGTVPVLVRTDGKVIDESLEVMHWALAQHDPEHWLFADPDETAQLIAQNDGPFKHALDRYKYPDRYSADRAGAYGHRSAGMDILHALTERLEDQNGQLCGPAPTLADIAIFPFVRQFAATDEAFWTEHAPTRLQIWLTGHTTSRRFNAVMVKFPRWKPGQSEPMLTAT
jgi:glutathione S-transferase